MGFPWGFPEIFMSQEISSTAVAILAANFDCKILQFPSSSRKILVTLQLNSHSHFVIHLIANKNVLISLLCCEEFSTHLSIKSRLEYVTSQQTSAGNIFKFIFD